MPALTPDVVPGLVAGGASARVESDIKPRFKVGDAVRTLNVNPVTHTRLPRYVRGKLGVVQRAQGTFHFNDAVAHGKNEIQHAYSVRFTFQELWGEGHDPRGFLYIDMFDEYLVAEK